MADDGLSIAGAADIEFKTVSSMVKSEVKGCQRVLRGKAARATVTEQ